MRRNLPGVIGQRGFLNCYQAGGPGEHESGER